jgi:hypothetical protein
MSALNLESKFRRHDANRNDWAPKGAENKPFGIAKFCGGIGNEKAMNANPKYRV